MLSDSFLDDLQPSMVQKYEVPTTFIFKFLLFALEVKQQVFVTS